MKKCERMDYCTFFTEKLASMPSSVDMFKRNYCMADKHNCARYMIHQKLREGYAPASDDTLLSIEREMKRLYPNDADTAKKVIGWLAKV